MPGQNPLSENTQVLVMKLNPTLLRPVSFRPQPQARNRFRPLNPAFYLKLPRKSPARQSSFVNLKLDLGPTMPTIPSALDPLSPHQIPRRGCSGRRTGRLWRRNQIVKTQISVIISVTREMISTLKMIPSEARGEILKIHVRALFEFNLLFNIFRSNYIL